VGNDLDRGAEIISAPFARDHLRINLAGRDVVALAAGDPCVALVVAEVEIGLGPVVGDVDLAVLVPGSTLR
jgi:hypothetical protein